MYMKHAKLIITRNVSDQILPWVYFVQVLLHVQNGLEIFDFWSRSVEPGIDVELVIRLLVFGVVY